MDTEYFVVDNSSECQTIENLGTASPYIQTPILSDTLVIKPINLSDDSRFVVSSQEGDSVFVSHFQSQEKQESLNTIFSSVNIIAHKDVVRIRWESSNFEEL